MNTSKCSQCNAIKLKDETQQICNECEATNNMDNKEKENSPALGTEVEKNENSGSVSVRKSARTTRYKSQTSKSNAKGKSRRNIFKKVPFKIPKNASVESAIKNHLFHEGVYMQVGDIVKLEDKKGNAYYAQIRSLLVDTYQEKSAVITWLIPTTSSPDPNIEFDPATYLVGFSEEIPRKLDCMSYVTSCPSNYYYDKTTPFPEEESFNNTDNKGFIWTSM